MKIKITIPQIRARKVTHPRTDADEIYLAYFVSLAKPGKELDKTDVRKYVVKKVSPVKNRVKNGRKWQPEDLEAIVETGSAETLYLTFALYECDDGQIYKKLVEQSDVLVNPEDFDWSTITVPEDLTSWLGWVKCVWKLMVNAYNYFKQDDLLGQKSIAIPMVNNPNDREWTGLREYRIKKFGGDYRVALRMEPIE